MSKQIFVLIVTTAILLAFHALVVSAFSVQINWPANINFIEKSIYLNRFYSDFFIGLGLASLFYGKNSFLKFIAGLILFFFLTVFFIQFQSYTITGRFLPLIALENMEHTELLDSNNIIFSGIIWATLFIVACRLVHSLNRQNISLITRIGFAIIALIISSIVKNDKYFIDETLAVERSDFYNSGRPGFPHVSPLSELKDTLEDYQGYLYKQRWISNKSETLSTTAANFAFKYYEHTTKSESEFPLIHTSNFETPLPFDSLLKHSKLTKKASSDDTKKNIIVFFAEGLSSRIIQPYSQYLPGISPNIESFSKDKNIRINNYYNHTYATYRGLGGQLCSIYPVGRLYEDVNYNCLPHILNRHGYSTHFLYSQLPEKTTLDEVFDRAGFQEIDSGTTILEKLKKSDQPPTKLSNEGVSITDKELFLGLIEELKAREQSETPFFMGLYNLETHTGIHLFSDNTIYQRPNAENSYVLNTFHNFDLVFGLFWNYFKDSPHAQDTIVVLTSDHATFPSRDYLKLGIDASPAFADEIPFLIYHPDLTSNFQFDAASRTSLDFAPTVLNILGIESQKTAFIGTSLFAEKTAIPNVSTGSSYAIWHSVESEFGYWMQITNDTQRTDSSIAKGVDHFEFIKYTSNLERQNKLWPETELEPRKK